LLNNLGKISGYALHISCWFGETSGKESIFVRMKLIKQNIPLDYKIDTE
jgi:hypothetical protein